MFRTCDKKTMFLGFCLHAAPSTQRFSATVHQCSRTSCLGNAIKKLPYLVIGVPATKRMVYCLLPDCSFPSNAQIWSESFLACIYSWLFWTIVIPVPYFGQEIFVRSWGQVLQITSLVYVFMRQRDPSQWRISKWTRICSRMDVNSCLRWTI